MQGTEPLAESARCHHIPRLAQRREHATIMVDRGTKRKCPHCGTSYYDLNRQPITCPKCAAAYEMSIPVRPARGRAVVPPPRPRDELEREDAAEDEEVESAESEFEEAEDLPADEETFVSPDDENEDRD